MRGRAAAYAGMGPWGKERHLERNESLLKLLGGVVVVSTSREARAAHIDC